MFLNNAVSRGEDVWFSTGWDGATSPSVIPEYGAKVQVSEVPTGHSRALSLSSPSSFVLLYTLLLIPCRGDIRQLFDYPFVSVVDLAAVWFLFFFLFFPCPLGDL